MPHPCTALENGAVSYNQSSARIQTLSVTANANERSFSPQRYILIHFVSFLYSSHLSRHPNALAFEIWISKFESRVANVGRKGNDSRCDTEANVFSARQSSEKIAKMGLEIMHFANLTFQTSPL